RLPRAHDGFDERDRVRLPAGYRWRGQFEHHGDRRSRLSLDSRAARRSNCGDPRMRSSSPPTVKDIAALAKVSVGTVSRVLNRHADVDERLRARVEAAVRKLGYRRHTKARRVAQAKPRVVGLVLCND